MSAMITTATSARTMRRREEASSIIVVACVRNVDGLLAAVYVARHASCLRVVRRRRESLAGRKAQRARRLRRAAGRVAPGGASAGASRGASEGNAHGRRAALGDAALDQPERERAMDQHG